MIAVNVISAVFCIWIAALSAKGSILDMNARKYVVTLLYIRLPLFFAEFCWTIASTVLVFGGFYFFEIYNYDIFIYLVVFESDHCIHGIRITVILEWVLILGVSLGVFLVFNPHGHSMEESVMVESRKWKQKFNLV